MSALKKLLRDGYLCLYLSQNVQLLHGILSTLTRPYFTLWLSLAEFSTEREKVFNANVFRNFGSFSWCVEFLLIGYKGWLKKLSFPSLDIVQLAHVAVGKKKFLHRGNDLPAVVWLGSDVSEWLENGRKEWWFAGKRHRVKNREPAVISNKRKEWWIGNVNTHTDRQVRRRLF